MTADLMLYPDPMSLRCGVCLKTVDEVAFLHNINGCQRCDKHVGRDPCAIDGCSRTTAAHEGPSGFEYHDQMFICSTHWRAGCPAGSPERRVLNRLFRVAKKKGGFDQNTKAIYHLRRRYWRVWATVVKRVQRRCGGDIDKREIDQLFGWDKE
jgi:hypothetical protein